MRQFLQRLIASYVVLCLACTSNLVAQQDKRPLEHEDYDKWKSISGAQLSGDGNWLMYSLRDGKDATELTIRSTEIAKGVCRQQRGFRPVYL